MQWGGGQEVTAPARCTGMYGGACVWPLEWRGVHCPGMLPTACVPWFVADSLQEVLGPHERARPALALRHRPAPVYCTVAVHLPYVLVCDGGHHAGNTVAASTGGRGSGAGRGEGAGSGGGLTAHMLCCRAQYSVAGSLIVTANGTYGLWCMQYARGSKALKSCPVQLSVRMPVSWLGNRVHTYGR